MIQGFIEIRKLIGKVGILCSWRRGMTNTNDVNEENEECCVAQRKRVGLIIQLLMTHIMYHARLQRHRRSTQMTVEFFEFFEL